MTVTTEYKKGQELTKEQIAEIEAATYAANTAP